MFHKLECFMRYNTTDSRGNNGEPPLIGKLHQVVRNDFQNMAVAGLKWWTLKHN